jgi:hypothetical protein
MKKVSNESCSVMDWNKYNKIKEETLKERIENEYKKSSPYLETTHLNIFQIHNYLH